MKSFSGKSSTMLFCLWEELWYDNQQYKSTPWVTKRWFFSNFYFSQGRLRSWNVTAFPWSGAFDLQPSTSFEIPDRLVSQARFYPASKPHLAPASERSNLMMMMMMMMVGVGDDDDDDGYPAHSHHDKIPPWWGNVSNDKGGKMSVKKSHNTWKILLGVYMF